MYSKELKVEEERQRLDPRGPFAFYLSGGKFLKMGW